MDARTEARRDLARTRTLLADLLGPVRLIREGEAMFAEFAEPADRLLLTAAGGSSPLGLVARARNAYRRQRL